MTACTGDFSCSSRKSQVIARKCDWFICLLLLCLVGVISLILVFDSHLKTALITREIRCSFVEDRVIHVFLGSSVVITEFKQRQRRQEPGRHLKT